MRHYVLFFAVVALTLSIPFSNAAQTSEAAVNNFKNALKKAGNGDLDGAIEDYTRAITLSSRLGIGQANPPRSRNLFARGVEGSRERNLGIVDPFIAGAYSN